MSMIIGIDETIIDQQTGVSDTNSISVNCDDMSNMIELNKKLSMIRDRSILTGVEFFEIEDIKPAM